VEDDDQGLGVQEDTEAVMMAMMGFGGFDSTKVLHLLSSYAIFLIYFDSFRARKLKAQMCRLLMPRRNELSVNI